MSFRTRLTSFFLLIVVVPMVAFGFLMFRLIGDSTQGKADARAEGLASAAASLYESESAVARGDALSLARTPALFDLAALRSRLPNLASRAGLSRVAITAGGRIVADAGSSTAIAPGTVFVTGSGAAGPLAVTVSELTAAQYAHDLTASGVGVVVRTGGRTLSSTVTPPPAGPLPRQGNVTVGGAGYRAVTQTFKGFGQSPVGVTVLSSLAATSGTVGTSRGLAAAFIAGFVLLAFSFSVLASRALQGQLKRFLVAARRIGAGDFSSQIPVEGRDEFAALGEEFNNMSAQLERRVSELSQERARLRESIRRIEQTFASNLDREGLLEVALQTAIDAMDAECGRVSVRSGADGPLAEVVREGSLDGLETGIYESEREALNGSGLGEGAADGIAVASAALGAVEPGDRAHGVITVARRDRRFGDDDREVLRSLAAQATLALENVQLHFQVRRQAVTDDLTGLANHGRFQDLLGSEMEQVRRYEYPVGLIMLDIDDFKTINDTYGHQQGDVVLRYAARVMRQNSRDADSPARYGGEEMALILPHTDLEGSHAIAERIRAAIEELRIPRSDGEGTLKITASVGVAASVEGHKDALIADADAALYAAKRLGKNRTIKAPARAANASRAE
jgi:diguanylate cyclase (GGDEF)-like protein